MSKHTASVSIVRVSLAAIAAAASLTGLSWQAMAAEAQGEAEDVELTEVQVTGTRIRNPNVTSANPITSITGEEMRQLGIVNVADALTQLVPQNISTYTPFLTGDDQASGIGVGGGGMETLDRGSFFIGSTIANLRGLDPTFGTRTLTLVNGRRMVSSSNQADVVDLNIIPSNLLERVDVVTGGASATYGSGAMAGVVNLVLNSRMTGFNIDLDYGVNEAGDGGNPHLSLSGGTPLFGGRGHVLLGGEWRDQKAIRDCAEARDWCAESRAMFSNYSGFAQNVLAVNSPLPGYEQLPARFEMANVRYSQFAPAGTIYFNNANVTTDYRLTDDGTGIEEYALGFRGGLGSSAINGDGPLTTSGTPLRPSNETRSLFTNFEFDFTDRTTGYMQANYALTESLNLNRYTTGTYCVRYDAAGVAAVPGGAVANGETIVYGPGAAAVFDYDTGVQVDPPTRTFLFNNSNFRIFLDYSANGIASAMPAPGPSAPFWVLVSNNTLGATSSSPPTGVAFGNATDVQWLHINSGSATGAEYWILYSITLTADFSDPGTPAQLPAMGRNAYAFLNNLSSEAQALLRNSFGVPQGLLATQHGNLIDPVTGQLMAGASLTAGGGAGLDPLYGTSPCSGFTALRKVWNPQLQQSTSSKAETMNGVIGVKGRFGGDWRWDASYQYGKTDNTSVQNNVATNLRLSMAIDAVIDDRAGSATFGEPVCRVTRDGIPQVDYQGRPISDPDDLQALAAGCVPINLFGSSFTGADAERQQDAIDYAFVQSLSTGGTTLQVGSLTTSGTLWSGFGAGAVTAAFGVEFRKDTVDNKGTSGATSFYERADLAATWSDGFGGKTEVTEGYSELNVPFISGRDGLNQFSVNAGARYSSYYNKGGAGTTGQSARQNVFNWKVQAVVEPFEWVRLRLSRSRDLRAATYRELFINQAQLPDQFSGNNPWRQRSAFSTENQNERWGQVRVGNANLDPEKSDTLTLGMVLSPGGWAQGMRASIDYFNVRVKDGIATTFTAGNPIRACWEGSGNREETYLDGGIDPTAPPGINGLLDESLAACQEITFGRNPDGSRNLLDITTYNSARPSNVLPYQRRGIDVSLQYNFPLSRVVETLPGSVALTVRGTRALEASGIELRSGPFVTAASCLGTFEPQGFGGNCSTYVDAVGQIRSPTFIPGVSASPEWTGNIIASYLVGNLTTSLSTRYIGGAVLDKRWCDDADCPNYQNELGQFLVGSVDNNRVKSYFNFSLNSSYNLQVAHLRQFQVFGSINNLFDKSPPFTGGGISGASAGYHDTMGRAYRVGVRMKF